MSSASKIKMIFVFLCIGSTTLFSANESHKKFNIETGMIFYTISGGGKLTEDVNLSIEGKGKLRFKDWGDIALLEENFIERTSGALQNIETIQRCTKLENKQRFDVDFKNKKIMERKMPRDNFQEHITEGLVKNGQEKIAGYTCDIWEGLGVRKCIYQGIPLLIEHYLLGVYYQKKASSITFNIKPSPSKCSIPKYPIQKFALFNTNMKTKSQKLPKELSKILMSVAKDMQKQLADEKIREEDFSPQEKRIWLDRIGQNVFEKQKVLLPKFLLSMKKARVCLQQAENWIDANECVRDVVQLKAKLTQDRQNNIELWKGEEKRKVLDAFDENILFLESKMRCIRGAKNISDLSNCMK